MKLALRHAVLSLSLLSLSFAPTVQAAKPKRPNSVKDLKSYEFEVKKKAGNVRRMRIRDAEYGLIGRRNSGFIDYEVAMWRGKRMVHIDLVKGVRRTRGVGEMLTTEVLRRYPKERIKAELAYTNRMKLLKAWAEGYPHATRDTDGESLRDSVPAFKFDGFDYLIKPVGGSVHLIMTPAKKGSKGSIVVEKPRTLDAILVSVAPDFIPAKKRPKSDKDLKKEKRENESAAKDAANMIEKFADKFSRDEDVDERDLTEHLFDQINDACGRGGSSGSGWAKKCLFVAEGRTYVVEIKGSTKAFDLDDLIEEEAEEFAEDQR